MLTERTREIRRGEGWVNLSTQPSPNYEICLINYTEVRALVGIVFVQLFFLFCVRTYVFVFLFETAAHTYPLSNILEIDALIEQRQRPIPRTDEDNVGGGQCRVVHRQVGAAPCHLI